MRAAMPRGSKADGGPKRVEQTGKKPKGRRMIEVDPDVADMLAFVAVNTGDSVREIASKELRSIVGEMMKDVQKRVSLLASQAGSNPPRPGQPEG